MRRYRGAWLGLLGCGLLVGCNGLESRYASYGIGADLATADGADSAALEDAYLGTLCRRAGLPLVEIRGPLVCAPGAGGGRDWAAIVEAGMNDIDQRCDAYLAWLDNRRRWTNPILKQIGDTNTAVTTILTATHTALPSIGIVAAAFGLARNTFVNLNSRLLYEIDQTTIQTLVLRRQTEFRQDLNRRALATRPGAVYALRQYLRICMPFTIETEINSTVTAFERGGAAGLSFRKPLIDARAIDAQIVDDPAAPLPKAYAVPVTRPGGKGRAEQRLTGYEIRLYSSFACVKEDDALGSKTIDAVLRYLDRTGTKDKARPGVLTFNDKKTLQVDINDGKSGC